MLYAALLPLREAPSWTTAEQFNRAEALFEKGQLQKSQRLAHLIATSLPAGEAEWQARFRMLEARAASWRGLDQDALNALAFTDQPGFSNGTRIEHHALLAQTFTHMHQFQWAVEQLAKSQQLCSPAGPRACGELIRARASLAIQRGQNDDAYRFYRESLVWEQRFGDRFEEAAALMNLGGTCLYEEHYDEAIDWLKAANHAAQQLNAGDILVNNLGNLGWAYYKLGESDRALKLYRDAESHALDLGDIDDAIVWLSTAGYAYQDAGLLDRAYEAHHRAFDLASRIGNREDSLNALEDLTYVSIDSGRLSDADGFLKRLDPLIRATGNRLDMLAATLARGRLAAARHQDSEAEAIFSRVTADPNSQTSMKLDAEHELARLYEAEGRVPLAAETYGQALTTFEAQRDQLQSEDSKLPFLANAAGIYDDYIHVLVAQGKTGEALAVADQSRARTLEQGLGINSPLPGGPSAGPAPLNASLIARRSNATLLFYWLGEKQSYLWAVTQAKTAFILLPPRSGIVPLVERYRRALLGPEDASAATTEEGTALYRMLIEPAQAFIKPDSNVVVLSDGPLSLLNFETLVVPDTQPRFFIEDATVTSAPSLRLVLASTQRRQSSGHGLLLIGDAVSPDPSYPELPMATREMTEVEGHFSAASRTVIAQRAATPQNYLASSPAQFAYIHFVAHGTASRTDPLDSAIVLSPDSGRAGGDFKLYARDIIQYPLRARLVTISACYGSGDRSYAGEGLVGLSWAFLRAGAHNVVGALWEVSDESTPRLMDKFYAGIVAGQSPAAALRNAKLALLHSKGDFSRPFYWAPFQLYTGL